VKIPHEHPDYSGIVRFIWNRDGIFGDVEHEVAWPIGRPTCGMQH